METAPNCPSNVFSQECGCCRTEKRKKRFKKSKNAKLNIKGLFPYYIISYNKQGSFQMITEDYSKGPRVVTKDYVLWKIQNMPSFSVAHSSLVLR